jgi:hypothetical protein
MRSTCSWVNTPPQRFQNIPNLDQYRLRWHSDNQGRISSPPNAHVFVAGTGHFFEISSILKTGLSKDAAGMGAGHMVRFVFQLWSLEKAVKSVSPSL